MPQPWALKDLPPFRPVALKLVRLTAKENIPIGEVLNVLRTDVAFSAEVLRFANSALVGMRTGTKSVSHAVEILGLEQVKALAMTIALRDFLSKAKANSFVQNCWRYNLATATICEWLASFLPIEADICYTAGLVHDVGRLALLRGFPKEYERATAGIATYDFDLLACERDAFEIDHCEAGRWLMNRWEFPVELQDVAALHHLQPGPDIPPLVAVVSAGWQIADMLGFSPLATRSDATVEEITVSFPETAREQIFARLDELPALVARKIDAAESSHS
jgi:HD-like signal output (HDOD) protein